MFEKLRRWKKREPVVFFERENRSTTGYGRADVWQRQLLLILGAGVLMTDAIRMLGDIFPYLTHGVEEMHWIGVEFLLCWLFYGVAFPFLENKSRKGHRIFRIGIVVIGLLLLASYVRRYYLADPLHVEDGFLMYAQAYLGIFNAYYKTNFLVDVGLQDYIPIALGISILVMVFVLWNLYYLTKKTAIFAGMPLLVLMALLLIGVCPDYSSLCLFVWGIFLLRCCEEKTSRGRRSEIAGKRNESFAGQQGIPVPFAALFLLLIGMMSFVNQVGQRSAQHMMEKSDEVLSWHKEMEENIKTQMTRIPSVATSHKREGVDNRKPSFSGQKMVKITTSGAISGRLYLKNYQGMVYERGSWIYDEKILKKEADENGIDVSDIQELLSLVNKSVSGETTYEMTYYGGVGDGGLFPYFSDVAEGKVKPVADVRYTRKKSLKTLQAKGLSTNLLSVQQLEVLERQTNQAGDEQLWNWYADFVREHYLEVPRALPTAKELAEKLGGGYLAASSWSNRNTRRLATAYEVQRLLNSGYAYSLELDKITDGMDSVEYMLSVGKKGYCEHFATAGVMILRSMDVPARYACGYVVSPDGFALNEDGVYEYTVTDADAHAWAEIYLEDLGWIPIEMTPGYADGWGSGIAYPQTTTIPPEDLMTTGRPWEEVYPESSKEPEESAAPTESPEATGSPQPDQPSPSPDAGTPGQSPQPEKTPEGLQPAETQKPKESAAPNGKDDQKKPGKLPGTGSSGDGAEPVTEETQRAMHPFVKGLLCCIGILILACCIGLIYLQSEEKKRQQLAGLFRNRHYNRAVKKMHQKLCRKLRGSGRIRMNANDAEVLKALKSYYGEISGEDWERYMEIAKEAFFSNREMEEERAIFFRSIFRKAQRHRRSSEKKRK